MNKHNNEEGLAIVEATILMPFCILMVIAVFYAAIFLCQKANLQANLQNALVYYKNVGGDTYVVPNAEMAYKKEAGTVGAVGSAYSEPVLLFPYRFLGTALERKEYEFNSGNFEKFFRSMSGYMFFDDGTNIEVKVDNPKNYIVYRKYSATAMQEVRPAISLAMLGIDNKMTISAKGTVVVSDSDDLIRNVDFVVDIIMDTKFGEWVNKIGEKVGEMYTKVKDLFDIE